jgi:hypothetical protein
VYCAGETGRHHAFTLREFTEFVLKRAFAAEVFTAADKNQDGHVTHSELRRYLKSHRDVKIRLLGEHFTWQEVFNTISLNATPDAVAAAIDANVVDVFEFDEFTKFVLYNDVRLTKMHRVLAEERKNSPFGALSEGVLAQSDIMHKTAVMRRVKPKMVQLRVNGDFYSYSTRASQFILFEPRGIGAVNYSLLESDTSTTACGFKVRQSTYLFPEELNADQRKAWLAAHARCGYTRGIYDDFF